MTELFLASFLTKLTKFSWKTVQAVLQRFFRPYGFPFPHHFITKEVTVVVDAVRSILMVQATRSIGNGSKNSRVQTLKIP